MEKKIMTSMINALFVLIVTIIILLITNNYFSSKEIVRNRKLIQKYEEYFHISQQVIEQQEYNSCLQDQIINYYEYAKVPSELQCIEPLAAPNHQAGEGRKDSV